MKFECTKRFKSEYKQLKKNNSKIFEDLKKDLFNLSIEELFNHYQILGNPHLVFRMKKHRCRNSNRNQSASGGYRIYFHINKEKQIVRLMTIYCKVGKKSKLVLTPEEEKEIKEELKEHNLKNSFIEICVNKDKIEFKVPIQTTVAV